jgi:TatD DNase family protein
LDKELSDARNAGITGWFSSALCRAEYEWHLQQEIKGMKWCAGIHPYYEKSNADDFDLLIELCSEGNIVAVGEIDLDSRNLDEDWQKDILLKQLELARAYELPVVFHVVKRYYELHKLLKNNFPKVRGWLHGFNSSMAVMEAFSMMDLGFSMNARLPKAEVVKKIVKRGFWQIETDAPYALPANVTGEYNSLKNLIWVRDEIENITGEKLWK